MEDTYDDEDDIYADKSPRSDEMDLGDREPLSPFLEWPEEAYAKHIFGSDDWLNWRLEIIADWNKAFPGMKQPINLAVEGTSYLLLHPHLSDTIIFCLESDLSNSSEDQSVCAEVYAINSSDGNLYQITAHQFDHRFVEYAIHGEVMYFFSTNRSLDKPTHYKIETYNIRTTQWDSFDGGPAAIIRLWPDSLPVYASILPFLKTKWAKYFRCCILPGNISFCFENTTSQPCHLIVRKHKDHVNNSQTQIIDDDEFVRDHEIDLGPYVKDCCDIEYSTFFLNHIKGLRFCLHVFFSQGHFPNSTCSLCVFTFELAKVKEGPIKIRDDPAQFKARKGEFYVFEIHRTLNRNYFKLPRDGFPRSCVKVENGESRRLQMTRPRC